MLTSPACYGPLRGANIGFHERRSLSAARPLRVADVPVSPRPPRSHLGVGRGSREQSGRDSSRPPSDASVTPVSPSPRRRGGWGVRSIQGTRSTDDRPAVPSVLGLAGRGGGAGAAGRLGCRGGGGARLASLGAGRGGRTGGGLGGRQKRASGPARAGAGRRAVAVRRDP